MVTVVTGEVKKKQDTPVSHTPRLDIFKKRITERQQDVETTEPEEKTQPTPKPVANVIVVEKQILDTGASRLAVRVGQPRQPVKALSDAIERQETGVSSFAQKYTQRPVPDTQPFITNRQGVITGANPRYIPPGKVRDVITGQPIKPPVRKELTYETWRNMSSVIQENVRQSSTGITGINPFGLKSFYYTVTGKTDRDMFEDIYKPTFERIHRATKDPLDATKFGLFETIPGLYYTSVAGGFGLGVLTKALPAVGTATKAGITAYGTYTVGQATVPPAIKGYKTGDWSEFRQNIVNIGVSLPVIAVGFKTGYNINAVNKVPTISTRGTTTLSIIERNVMNPLKTAVNRIDPRNLWVRWKATKVDPDTFISKAVMEGRTRFPTSPNVKRTLDLFEKGYDPQTGLTETVHARAYPMKGQTITTTPPTRGTDVYGLYVSSKGQASPYFLRLGTKVPDYGYTPMQISILPKKPSFRVMFVESIMRAPKAVRYSITRFKDWQMRTTPSSTATITPAHELGIKAEIEAVISPRAGYKSIAQTKGFIQKAKGYTEYTTYMGKDIPIYKYQVMGTGKGVIADATKMFKNMVSDYYYSTTKSAFSPSYVSMTSGMYGLYSSGKTSSSYTPSKTPSYTPSKMPSYTPSKTPSYTPSKTPSYVPSRTPSYTPSKTSSYTPSKTPSYVPSYTPSRTPSYTPSGTPSYTLSRVPPPPYYKEDYSGVSDDYNKGGAYDVFVKERSYVRGKKRYPEAWKKANTKPLSEKAALSLGATAVDQSAAASFKVKPTGGKASPLRIPVSSWDMLQGKFYKKNNTYIESTTHRIDSTGEIQGISALGWIASQNRLNRALRPARIHSGASTASRTIRASYDVDMSRILRGVGL